LKSTFQTHSTGMCSGHWMAGSGTVTLVLLKVSRSQALLGRFNSRCAISSDAPRGLQHPPILLSPTTRQEDFLGADKGRSAFQKGVKSQSERPNESPLF